MPPIVTGPLPPATQAAVRGLAAEAERADGVEPLGEQTLLDLTAPGAVHVLVPGSDPTTLLAYGHLGPVAADPAAPSPAVTPAAPSPRVGPAAPRAAELVVAPGARGNGLGRAVLDALLTAAGSAPVAVWAHGSLPAALRLAAGAGLVPVRELWQMALALPGAATAADTDQGPGTAPPPSPLPAGVTVRPFRPGADEERWLAANAAAFAHHPEQGRTTLDDLRARMAEPWFRAGDLLLAERGGDVVGFAWLKVEPPDGEVYVLGVTPPAQGTGLGRALTAHALEHLEHRGVSRAVLFVDADNEPAVRTYRRAGFAVVRRDTQLARTATADRVAGDAPGTAPGPVTAS